VIVRDSHIGEIKTQRHYRLLPISSKLKISVEQRESDYTYTQIQSTVKVN